MRFELCVQGRRIKDLVCLCVSRAQNWRTGVCNQLERCFLTRSPSPPSYRPMSLGQNPSGCGQIGPLAHSNQPNSGQPDATPCKRRNVMKKHSKWRSLSCKTCDDAELTTAVRNRLMRKSWAVKRQPHRKPSVPNAKRPGLSEPSL